MTLKKKILILGSTGMLGHQVVHYFSRLKNYQVMDIAFRSKLRDETIVLDVTNKTELEDIVTKLKPDFIVNCIGVLIHGSINVENAIYLNAYLPQQLKTISKNIGAKLIHISTDCVFSGKKGGYIETDVRDGKGVYARTKILGEVIDDLNVTLRTSIVGPELKPKGEGLFHWFMHQSESVNGFTESYWSGVTTIELSRFIEYAINHGLTGLYHVTNGRAISKYELLKLFGKYTKKDIEIIPVSGKKVNKSFIDTRNLVDYSVPSYEVMIEEMIKDIELNASLYPYIK